MLLPESDIAAWREELRGRDAHKKTAQQEAMNTQFNKPVTWRDVKQKDLDYHPILQKFARDEKVPNQMSNILLICIGKH